MHATDPAVLSGKYKHKDFSYTCLHVLSKSMSAQHLWYTPQEMNLKFLASSKCLRYYSFFVLCLSCWLHSFLPPFTYLSNMHFCPYPNPPLLSAFSSYFCWKKAAGCIDVFIEARFTSAIKPWDVCPWLREDTEISVCFGLSKPELWQLTRREWGEVCISAL